MLCSYTGRLIDINQEKKLFSDNKTENICKQPTKCCTFASSKGRKSDEVDKFRKEMRIEVRALDKLSADTSRKGR
jgi:hypothetical protein